MTRYQIKRARGLCGDCGRVESDAARCPECKVRNAFAVDAVYRRRRAAGLCVECAAPSLRARCAACEARNARTRR